MRVKLLGIAVLMLFNMVAVQSGPTGGSSSASANTYDDEMASLSKALVSVTKLNGANYDVWYARLLAILMVGTKLRRVVATALNGFKENMDKSVEEIKNAVKVLTGLADAKDVPQFTELNTIIFSIVYGSISDCTEMASSKMYGAKKVFGDGMAQEAEQH
jgi:hypothetical protein